MACFIAQRYTEKVTVQDIAEHVQLHPNYAMNLFQRTFGTTLINYLTQHRVSHAQRLLATSDESIADVAFNSGFNSISRFNDAFRRACGCSPRDYRRTHYTNEGAR
jgi:AraC-like DNA-binding protein